MTMRNNGSMFSTLALVSGLALSAVGGVMFMANRPMSESEAINNAVRVTVDADGKKWNHITGAERHQAVRNLGSMNAARAGRRSVGGALAAGGLVLLVAGCIACKGRPPEAAQQV
jgi:hypothetical protein